MTEKSRIQYLGNGGEKWIAVRIPVSGAEGDTRHYEFRAGKVDGLLEISENWSALLLENEKQIPVNLPLKELRRRFHGRGNAANQLDLTDVTGLPYTEEVQDGDLKAAFTATLPEAQKNNGKPQKTQDLQLSVFVHVNLKETPGTIYRPATIAWSNVIKIEPAVYNKAGHSYLGLRNGVNGRTGWYVDVPADQLMEMVNKAQISGTTHIDLRERTRKHAAPRSITGARL